MPKTARKTFALEDTALKTWFERDRAHVDLQDRETGQTLIEFWDEDVEQLLEDGFLNRRALHSSLYEYAVHLGAIKAPKSALRARTHATMKTPTKKLRVGGTAIYVGSNAGSIHTGARVRIIGIIGTAARIIPAAAAATSKKAMRAAFEQGGIGVNTDFLIPD